MTTVQEIHNEFFSAEEKLLNEAKAIIDKPLSHESEKADRLKKLGFDICKPITEVKGFAEKQTKAKELHAAILYFRQRYPNNKFITEVEVKRICDKYGLVMGDAANYTGDIPEKNIIEIENFKLKQEDWVSQRDYCFFEMDSLMETQLYFDRRMSREMGIRSSRTPSSNILSDRYDRRTMSQIEYDEWERQYYRQAQRYATTKPVTAANATQPKFKICAPKADFNTAGYVIQDGFKLVYDPVVLQPVKNGFLIVSAWGDEAADELVVNQKMN